MAGMTQKRGDDLNKLNPRARHARHCTAQRLALAALFASALMGCGKSPERPAPPLRPQVGVASGSDLQHALFVYSGRQAAIQFQQQDPASGKTPKPKPRTRT
jgi:hypothetical protein